MGEIQRLMDENMDSLNKISLLESEQQILSLNNGKLNSILETKTISLKNMQRQYQIVKNKYNKAHELNEQHSLSLDAKNDHIQQLKKQNEKLEHLNEETMSINYDLRHQMEQRHN